MTGPEFDDDLNQEYRAQAVEREAGVERIERPTFGLHPGRPADYLTAPKQGWLQRRQAKVAEEIERNRRGEYTVPTWVLTLILVVVVLALVALFTLV